jgi:hypothetical protein
LEGIDRCGFTNLEPNSWTLRIQHCEAFEDTASPDLQIVQLVCGAMKAGCPQIFKRAAEHRELVLHKCSSLVPNIDSWRLIKVPGNSWTMRIRHLEGLGRPKSVVTAPYASPQCPTLVWKSEEVVVHKRSSELLKIEYPEPQNTKSEYGPGSLLLKGHHPLIEISKNSTVLDNS